MGICDHVTNGPPHSARHYGKPNKINPITPSSGICKWDNRSDHVFGPVVVVVVVVKDVHSDRFIGLLAFRKFGGEKKKNQLSSK